MFYSLSQYPGKTGEFYYNTFFKRYNLPYTYTALECTDLKSRVAEMREKAMGFSVSMPFKEEILDYLEVVEPAVASYSSCNTVKVRDGVLIGYNSDIYGAHYVKTLIPEGAHVAILGDGSMGKMLRRVIPQAEIFSRQTGNWEKRYNVNGVVINCTSFGTATTDSPFYVLPPVKMVIDLAIKDNQLRAQCEQRGIGYVPGIEFYKHQFIKQFEIYTDTKLSLWDFDNIQK